MEILPHFWIGYSKQTLNVIKKKKIKNIIHLSKYSSFFKLKNIDEIRIPINYEEEDNLEQKNIIMYQHLFDITDYIHEKIINNEKILILGEEEKQDLDCILVAYFIKYGKLTIAESISFLHTKKENIFFPKCLFFHSLNKFYHDLKKI